MIVGLLVAAKAATVSLTAALSMFGGVASTANQADAYQAFTSSATAAVQSVQADWYHAMGAAKQAATNSVQNDWYHGLAGKDGWGADKLQAIKADAYRMAPAATTALQALQKAGRCDCLTVQKLGLSTQEYKPFIGALSSLQRFGLGSLQKVTLGAFARLGLGSLQKFGLGSMLGTLFQRPDAAGPGGLGLAMQRLGTAVDRFGLGAFSQSLTAATI